MLNVDKSVQPDNFTYTDEISTKKCTIAYNNYNYVKHTKVSFSLAYTEGAWSQNWATTASTVCTGGERQQQ